MKMTLWYPHVMNKENFVKLFNTSVDICEATSSKNQNFLTKVVFGLISKETKLSVKCPIYVRNNFDRTKSWKFKFQNSLRVKESSKTWSLLKASYQKAWESNKSLLYCWASIRKKKDRMQLQRCGTSNFKGNFCDNWK